MFADDEREAKPISFKSLQMARKPQVRLIDAHWLGGTSFRVQKGRTDAMSDVASSDSSEASEDYTTFSYIHHLSVKSQLILADSAADSPMLKIAALYTRGIPLFPTAEVIEILERLTPREK